MKGRKNMFKEKEYWMPNNDWDYEENDKQSSR